MANIIEYGISRSLDIAVVTNDVNVLIAQGWQPFGSLTSSMVYVNNMGQLSTPGEVSNTARVMYAQAVVRYAQE